MPAAPIQYSYVTQAGLWRTGTLQIHQDIVRDSPWPGAPETWTPLGFRTIPGNPGAIASVYPPGLPLLMALFQIIAGYCGAFLVVPICSALTVWLTYLLGRRLFDAPHIGLLAAALVAASPVFLYQIMNAMSDVPVTAAWTLALLLLVSDRPLLSGLAVGAAILIRPNLAPVSGVFVLWLAVTNRASVWRFAAGLAPALGAVLLVNWRMYGSPLTSGYGELGHYYAWEYALANLRRYPVWIVDTQTPLVLLALCLFVAPAWLPPPRVPRLRLLFGGFIGIVFLSYLFYTPFDAWWFLRFLLPIWPAIMVPTRGGAGRVRAAMDRAVVVGCRVGHRGGCRLARCAVGRRAQRLRSGVGRSAVRERRAIRGGAHGARCGRSLEAA